MRQNLAFAIVSIGMILLLPSCGHEYLPGFDFTSFNGTPVEELAKAVEDDDAAAISSFVKENPGLVDYQETEFGHSVLFLAVVNQKYNAVKSLLDNGASLSVKSYSDSSDVLMTLCNGYGDTECDTVMLNLLLKYSPDLRSIHYDSQGNGIPLLRTAAKSGMCIVFIKTLVAAGADINYLPNNEADDSPIAAALMQDRLDLVKYFLIEEQAKVPAYCFIRSEKTGPDSITVTRLLNEQDYSRDPKQQKLKQEILTYLQSAGKQ